MSLMLAGSKWAWAADLDGPHPPAELVSEKRHRKHALQRDASTCYSQQCSRAL